MNKWLLGQHVQIYMLSIYLLYSLSVLMIVLFVLHVVVKVVMYIVCIGYKNCITRI